MKHEQKSTATREQKSARVSVKSFDDETGRFRAIVSVFGNEDSYGDVMQKGSFARSLGEWKTSGDPIPFIWDHRIDDPNAYIGEIIEARETDEGLEVEGVFDLEDATAAKAYRLLKSRRVREWSFGFIIPPGGAKFAEQANGRMVREVHEAELLEVSMTLVGANRATRTVEVRSAAAAEASGPSLDELDATLGALTKAADGLKAAQDMINETTATVRAARDELEAKSKADEVSDKPEGEPEGEDGSGNQESESGHAAANETPTSDEDSTESKSFDAIVAAANVAVASAMASKHTRKG
jgi:HK97 family phage prohead protease